MPNFTIDKKAVLNKSRLDTQPPLDRDMIGNLASTGLSTPEIAMVLGVKPSRLEKDKEIVDIIQKSHGALIANIRQKQVQVALKEGSVPMLKWLGTEYLGQSDKPKVDVSSGESHNSQFEGIEFVEYDEDEEVALEEESIPEEENDDEEE